MVTKAVKSTSAAQRTDVPKQPAAAKSEPKLEAERETFRGSWLAPVRKQKHEVDADGKKLGYEAAKTLRAERPVAAIEHDIHATVFTDIDPKRAYSATPDSIIQAAQNFQSTEAKLLAKLSPEQQKQYADILRYSKGSVNMPDLAVPQTRLGLMQLLGDGTLQDTDTEGKTLLSTLSKLATDGSLARAVDRRDLINELVLELAQPSTIDQKDKLTCGAGLVAIYMASTRPAEYARIVAGLVSEEGKVKLAGGEKLKRPKDVDSKNAGGRTITQQILQPTLMDLGNGPLLGYSNKADKNTLLGVPLFNGALLAFVGHALKEIVGKEIKVDPDIKPTKKTLAHLEEKIAQGEPVPVAFQYRDKMEGGFHWVMVVKVDKENVTYVNPWGREEFMPRKEFRKKILGVVAITDKRPDTTAKAP